MEIIHIDSVEERAMLIKIVGEETGYSITTLLHSPCGPENDFSLSKNDTIALGGVTSSFQKMSINNDIYLLINIDPTEHYDELLDSLSLGNEMNTSIIERTIALTCKPELARKRSKYLLKENIKNSRDYEGQFHGVLGDIQELKAKRDKRLKAQVRQKTSKKQNLSRYVKLLQTGQRDI